MRDEGGLRDPLPQGRPFPRKHVAGVYYLMASELDDDPFLMFELRGRSRQELRNEQDMEGHDDAET